MGLINLEQYTDKQNRAISRVLDTLDRLEKRTDAHFSDNRAHERKNFRGVVWIATDPVNRAVTDEVNAIKVWSRSISQSGLSFIYPFRIYQKLIQVGIPVQDNQVTWFRVEIVRDKEIEEEQFWEYGVRFLGKVND
ncbi:PilZ domain-containing protein [uncultured Gimesia sp.]|uniref:PilZ domain-containing protein n=1 Tax=uncultured Gimesia sp. TaxID=1678688 RepID=UPI00262E3D55|nr:PilZ domain-containing protein [uncultured Gimesia sp.]